MAQTRYDNVSAGEYARQHNGNVTNNYSYNYGLRTRRSDETLREDQRNLLLLRAAAEGQLPRMQHLFRLGVDIDFSDDEGFTALHHSVLSGFEDCVKEWINWGSDVNALTPHGMPLNLAAQKERRHVISILVAARADKVRAVDFASAHGQSVGDLCTLLHVPLAKTTADPSSSSGIDGDGVLGEIRLAAPVAAEADTRTSDEPNHLHHAANKESAAESDELCLPDLQHDFSPRQDESHIPDQETAACHVEEDGGQESGSESFSERTYASHSSQQSINHLKESTPTSHDDLRRNRAVFMYVEDLSNLPPMRWRRPDHDTKDQKTARDRAWRKINQRSPSPVLVQPDAGLGLDRSTGQKITIESLDEHRDRCMRENRNRESIVHDWFFRRPSPMHDFPRHTDHSTSQDPKAHFPVDRHSATDFAPGHLDAGPGRKELPTDDSLAALSSGKYRSETTKARDRQRFIPQVRRLPSDEPTTRGTTDKPVRESERTKNSSPSHGGNNSSPRRRELPPLGNDILTPDAANSTSSVGYRRQTQIPKKSRATNDSKATYMLEDSIGLLIPPELEALKGPPVVRWDRQKSAPGPATTQRPGQKQQRSHREGFWIRPPKVGERANT